MKREREEESEEEVFERRRKVHKQEKTEKNEIEDLFEHSSADAEESSKEEHIWGMEEATHVGVLLEIFGDGTDYLHVLEAQSKLQKEREGGQKEKEPEATKEKKIDTEKIIEATARRVMEGRCLFDRSVVVQIVEDVLNGKDTTESMKSIFHYMNTIEEMFQFMQIRSEVENVKKKEHIMSILPIKTERAKIFTKYADYLKSANECSRLARYLHAIESCTEEEVKIAITATELLLGIFNPQLQPQPKKQIEIDKPSNTSRSFNGLIGNPWFYSAAVEIAMDIGEIEIAAQEMLKVQASRICSTDMLLLASLKERGLVYKTYVCKESLYKQIMKKINIDVSNSDSNINISNSNINNSNADNKTQINQTNQTNIEKIEKSVKLFIEASLSDICKGVERGLLQCAEKTVQLSLFKKLIEISFLQSKKLGVSAYWSIKGKIRHTKVDAEENVVASGVQDSLLSGQNTPDNTSSSVSSDIFAVTGTGHKIKPYLKRQKKVFIPENMLLRCNASKDLSSALCFFIKHPCRALESIISSEGQLPCIVPFQGMLDTESVRKIWKFAVSCAKARNAFFSSPECLQLKRDFMTYLKAGGNIFSIEAPKYITIKEMRRQIRNTATPHTSWTAPTEEVILDNQILLFLYKQCVHKIEGTSFIPSTPTDAREEFLAVYGIEEKMLRQIETKWQLASKTNIFLEGPVYEGAVTFIGAEIQVKLRNGIYGTLQASKRNLQIGQQSSFQIIEVDIQQKKVHLSEKSSESNPLVLTHWQIKKVSAKGAFRILKEKPFGAYIIRPSSTYKDSLVLSIRITEKMDECICSHIQIKEKEGKYEIEGRSVPSLDYIITEYLPNYLSSLKRVTLHRKFYSLSSERIKEDILLLSQKESFPYAFSLSKTSPGAVSFIYSPKAGETNEIFLQVCENGLFHKGYLFHRPQDFATYIKKITEIPSHPK